jgi:hypothetical protein
MTGVEAVSNGVSAFREPRVRHAHGTLAAIVIILGLLLLGVAHVAQAYGITAMDQTRGDYQSVLSQIVGAVCGRGWLYHISMGSVLAVLCLSANTSFVDFPRLCHLVAQDGYLPRPFAIPGRRLVYSAGILFLAVGSASLLIVFDGITDGLIPLFAVGAFLAFTLSQAGMAAHWYRRIVAPDKTTAPSRSEHAKLTINGLGAIATGATLAVILAAKFVEGAWLVVIVVPCTIVLLRAVRRYYEEIERQVLGGCERQIDLRRHAAPAILIPIKRWDRLSRKAIQYALRLSPDITALHITNLDGPEVENERQRLRSEWHQYVEIPAKRAGLNPPSLRFLTSEFRSMGASLLRVIEHAREHHPHQLIMVLLPELVEGRWWGYVMHASRERRLRVKLLRYGGPEIVVATVPWQLQPTRPAEGIAEEEPLPTPALASAAIMR